MSRRRERDQGVLSLFGDWNGDDSAEIGRVERIEIPDVEYPKAERLKAEKEMLGYMFLIIHSLALSRRFDVEPSTQLSTSEIWKTDRT